MSNPSTQLAERTSKPSALALMASRFSVDPNKLLDTLRSTVFKGANNEELLALVVVANEYGLNPLTKEIYAFPAKGGGIVPVVSVDGWNNLANSHPAFDGLDFEFAHDDKGALISCTCIIFRKDRSRPIKVTEYLSECRRNTEPWKMEHRMLRHKALIQCVRVAFGFSGVHDDEDGREIASIREIKPANVPTTALFAPAEPAPEPHADDLSDRQYLVDAMQAANVTWEQVARTAEAGGVFIDASVPIEDQPSGVLREVLSLMPNIVATINK